MFLHPHQVIPAVGRLALQLSLSLYTVAQKIFILQALAPGNSSVKIVVNLLLIHHIDTAQNLPSTYKRIIKGFNSHSNGVKLYNEMVSRVKVSRLNDALTSEGPWKRCFDFSASHLQKAICDLGNKFKEGGENEALSEATVLKSKLTQVAVDSNSFRSLDPDETNRINGAILETLSKPSPYAIHSGPNRACTLHRTMSSSARQPCRCIDIHLMPVRRSSGLAEYR